MVHRSTGNHLSKIWDETVRQSNLSRPWYITFKWFEANSLMLVHRIYMTISITEKKRKRYIQISNPRKYLSWFIEVMLYIIINQKHKQISFSFFLFLVDPSRVHVHTLSRHDWPPYAWLDLASPTPFDFVNRVTVVASGVYDRYNLWKSRGVELVQYLTHCLNLSLRCGRAQQPCRTETWILDGIKVKSCRRRHRYDWINVFLKLKCLSRSWTLDDLKAKDNYRRSFNESWSSIHNTNKNAQN